MTRDDLEMMIDSVGLGNVVDLLEEICYEKAEHLRSNWQDESAAKHWEHDAREFDKVRNRLNVPAYI